MFTGIVEEVGTIVGKSPSYLQVRASLVLDGTQIGDSISVSGCCLTVVELTSDGFSANVVEETLERTMLGNLGEGAQVNLERALAVGGRFGGHILQGHVDGVGTIQRGGDRLNVACPVGLMRYVVEKGSVAINGVSLTVASVGRDYFEVALVPHSLEVTTLGSTKVGDLVNLETDIVAKYVESLLGDRITLEDSDK